MSYDANALQSDRFNLGLMGSFAILALLLAALGIYGVMSYTTAQRTRELGIRLALGAQTRSLLKLVTLQGMKLALIGMALGLLGSFALTRLMDSLLFGVGHNRSIDLRTGCSSCWQLSRSSPATSRHAARQESIR